MENKKTIILGIIAIAVLAGIVWYGSQNKEIIEQAASVIESITDEEPAVEIVEIEEFVLGDPGAPVTMIDYSSHFCGHCAVFHAQTLPLIIDKYVKTGQVKIIFRLLSPPELSMALFCAHEQDAFQEFNDQLFEQAGELESIEGLKAIAVNLGLNQAQFNQCFDSEKYKEKAMKWFEQATESGIEGTPTFFINSQMIVGNQSYIVFEQVIEQALSQ